MSEATAPRKRAVRRSVTAEEPATSTLTQPEAAGYVAGRLMVFNGVSYFPGDPVPDAHTAARIQTLIANRYLKKV